MCPMKIKIKIANFSRVVKLIFGPLKKKTSPLRKSFFPQWVMSYLVGTGLTSTTQNHKNLCPRIDLILWPKLPKRAFLVHRYSYDYNVPCISCVFVPVYQCLYVVVFFSRHDILPGSFFIPTVQPFCCSKLSCFSQVSKINSLLIIYF